MVRVSSGKESKQDYGTPQYLFDYFNNQYKYDLDAAASNENHKCEEYHTVETNGLAQLWLENTVWINPPYNNVMPWVEYAISQILGYGCIGVGFLLNNDCSTKWYKELWNSPLHQHWSFIGHRIKFDGAKDPQSMSSVHVQIFGCVTDAMQSSDLRRQFSLVNPKK